MASYIAQSALTRCILEIVQIHDASIVDLTLDFADVTWHRANWHVATIDHGDADPGKVRGIVALVVRANASWVMVCDGSDLDGQVVPS